MKRLTDKLRSQIIKDILSLVSIRSVTGTDGIKECQQAVICMAEKLGFVTKLLAKGKVIVIEPMFASETPELGIVTHLDTVPFNKSEWTHNPLGEIADGRIYGRGVVDDKAAIVLAMYAFYLLAGSIRPSWQIIVGSSEEGEWTDMQEYLEEGHPLPKFSMTIDGDGIQNGCKGYMDLELKFTRNANQKSISQFYVPNGVANCVPAQAVATINGITLKMNGVAAHSSVPNLGDNALINLACYVNHMYHPTEFTGFFNLMEDFKNTSNSTLLVFPPHSPFFNEQFVGFTTICPTKCSIQDDTLTVNLNIRFVPGTTDSDIEVIKRTLSSKYDCVCSPNSTYKPPTYVSSNSKELKLLCKVYESVLGLKTTATVANGIGYNATLPNCIIFGPRFAIEHDEPDTCHAVDENRRIDDLIRLLIMLVRFCRKYLH